MTTTTTRDTERGTKGATMQYDLEAVYDQKIAPLMAQIVAICDLHGLPMVATFAYKRDGDDNWYGTDSVDSLNRAPPSLRLIESLMVSQGMTSE